MGGRRAYIKHLPTSARQVMAGSSVQLKSGGGRISYHFIIRHRAKACGGTSGVSLMQYSQLLEAHRTYSFRASQGSYLLLLNLLRGF